MWAEILTVLSVFLLSSLKYVVAVASTFATRWNPLVAFLVTSGGAITGIYVFTFLGERIFKYFRKKFPPKTKKPRITRRNRLIVRLRSGYGLLGVALLTPVILSIPVGCLVSLTIEHDRHKIVKYQVIAVLVWGILFFGLKALFNIDLGHYVANTAVNK